MTNDEMLDLLAENEQALFYAHCREPKNEALQAAHTAARNALEAFAAAIGQGADV